METGTALHARAEEILGSTEYDRATYAAALAQAAAEAQAVRESLTAEQKLSLLGAAMRANPGLRHEMEGHVLTAAANKILAREGREADADRFLEVFSHLARSSALYGFETT
jgi:hypothetical protein